MKRLATALIVLAACGGGSATTTVETATKTTVPSATTSFEQAISDASSCQGLGESAQSVIEGYDGGEIDDVEYVELLTSVLLITIPPTYEGDPDPHLCTEIAEVTVGLLFANAP
jgi:hypothetical protein